MNTTRYRVILALLGIVFIIIVVGAVLLTPSGDPGSVPSPVDAIAPEDGALVLRQTTVVLDLEPGYRAHLTIDGTPIPDSEVTVTDATGRHEYEPGAGKTIEAWSVGFHVVEATWDRISGLPDPGTVTWTFRVQ